MTSPAVSRVGLLIGASFIACGPLAHVVTLIGVALSALVLFFG